MLGKFDPSAYQSERIHAVAPDGTRVPSLAGIDEVRNKEEDTEKILSATGLVKILTAGLALLFEPARLLILVAGVLMGLAIGALPGLGGIVDGLELSPIQHGRPGQRSRHVVYVGAGVR